MFLLLNLGYDQKKCRMPHRYYNKVVEIVPTWQIRKRSTYIAHICRACPNRDLIESVRECRCPVGLVVQADSIDTRWGERYSCSVTERWVVCESECETMGCGTGTALLVITSVIILADSVLLDIGKRSIKQFIEFIWTRGKINYSFKKSGKVSKLCSKSFYFFFFVGQEIFYFYFQKCIISSYFFSDN